MNKTELADAVAGKTGLSKREALDAVNALQDELTFALSKGDSISLVGFGSFTTRIRKARDGKNPATGETIRIPERKTVSFKAGKKTRDAVQS